MQRLCEQICRRIKHKDWMLKKYVQNREEYHKEESGADRHLAVDLEEGEIVTLREQKEIKLTSSGDL